MQTTNHYSLQRGQRGSVAYQCTWCVQSHCDSPTGTCISGPGVCSPTGTCISGPGVCSPNGTFISGPGEGSPNGTCISGPGVGSPTGTCIPTARRSGDRSVVLSL